MISQFLLSMLLASATSALFTGCADAPQQSRITKTTSGDAASKEADKNQNSDVDDEDTITTSGSDDAMNSGNGTIQTGNGTEVKVPTLDPVPNPLPTEPVVDNSETAAIKKKCTPQVEYVNDNSAGGKKFAQQVPDAKLAMVQAAQYVCSILYKKASEVPNVTKVKLFLESMDGVAYATGGSDSKELHISTDYVNKIGGDAKLEIDGILIHENTHIWQLSGNGADGGLIEGIADYVRAGGNWYPAGSRNGKGGKYNDAYTTSAYFIGWINTKYPDFAYKFNLSMKAYPGAAVFKTITGVDADTLWNQYQSQGTFSPKVPDWVAKQVPLQLGK